MSNLRVLAGAVAMALIALPAALHAQQDGAPNDLVVARVDGEEIRHSEVMEMARALPPQYQAQLTQIYPLLVQRLVDFKLAGRAGRAAAPPGFEEVKPQLREEMARAAVTAVFNDLRDSATIEIVSEAAAPQGDAAPQGGTTPQGDAAPQGGTTP